MIIVQHIGRNSDSTYQRYNTQGVRPTCTTGQIKILCTGRFSKNYSNPASLFTNNINGIKGVLSFVDCKFIYCLFACKNYKNETSDFKKVLRDAYT